MPGCASEQVLSTAATTTTVLRSRIRLALSTRQPWATALVISLGCGLGRSLWHAIDEPHLPVGACPALSEPRADNQLADNDMLPRRGVAKTSPADTSAAARCPAMSREGRKPRDPGDVSANDSNATTV